MARTTDRTGSTRLTPRTEARPEPDYVELHEHEDRPLFARDRARWGAIVAGLVTAVTTLVILTVLGVAVGVSAFEPDETGITTIGTAAGIWGAASALLAFLIGGLVAGASAGVRLPGTGALNGFIMGAAAIALTLWLVGSGLGNLLGAAAANLGDLSAVNVSISGDDAQSAFANAEEGAWWTLVGLGAALFAATIGGWLGSMMGMQRRERER